MSELTLNAAPPPELVKTASAGAPAAPDRNRPAAGNATAATNPFAALLSGVLQGAQPAAGSAVLPAPPGEFPDLPLPEDPSAGGACPVALPGTALPLPAPVVTATGTTAIGSATTGPAGNLLPGSGKDLPLQLPGSGSAPAASEATARPGGVAPPASPSRIFLGDLAQSRPVDPGSAPGSAPGTDGAREAAAAVLGGRQVATPMNSRADSPARPPGLANELNVRPVNLLAAAVPAAAPAGADGLPLRPAMPDLLRGAGLPGAAAPGAGAELLAGQLAAFAMGSDNGASSASTSPVTGSATADAGSAALLGRLGNTGLPPLQPLGDAGAFAGGLADRLLTLGGPGAHSARLKLHPEHLGELDVEITMDDGTAQVWFGTTTSQARDAIEGSLPRLREMFADQGIQLTRTQIDAGGGQMGHSGFGQERRMTGGAGAWNDAPAWQPGRPIARAEPAGEIAAGSSTRLLDVWA